MIPLFKCRCSSLGKILGGALGKPTEKQLATITELEEKAAAKGLTEKQQATLAELILKRDNPPQLSDGAKTYCEEWLKEQIYNRRKEFSNKFTEKGTICEPEGIELVASQMNYGLIAKNEQQFENEYITGTPDLLLPLIVEDIKNSWSVFTFPLFAPTLPNSDYFFQLQGYMWLTDRTKAAVNYCLIDAPIQIMDREARSVWFKAGYDGDIDMSCYDEVYAKMTYPEIPDTLKIKRFEFDYSAEIIEVIKERVLLCREYIKSIIPKEVELLQAA